jgi:hypothetical protein
MSLDFFGIGSDNLLEIAPQPTPGHLGWGMPAKLRAFDQAAQATRQIGVPNWCDRLPRFGTRDGDLHVTPRFTTAPRLLNSGLLGDMFWR